VAARANKTQPTEVTLEAFLEGVTPPERRTDAQTLCGMVARLSGEAGVMWGQSIIGYGRRHYRYDSGREGDVPAVGFSPRKPALVLYLNLGAAREDFLARLGKHTTGKGCIYVKRLADVNPGVLEEMIVASLAEAS